MRLVITGASGFVGRQIIPFFTKDLFDLTLVGRDPNSLRDQFGTDVEVAGYEVLEETFAGADAILHLAVQNNAQDVPNETFKSVNVDLLKQVFSAAEKASVKHFVYVTTLHSQTKDQSHYATTKRDALAYLEQRVSNITLSSLSLPAVYGDNTFAGNLSVLYRIPKIFRRFAFHILAALRPTVHVKTVAQAAMGAVQSRDGVRRVVSDRQLTNPVYATLERIRDIFLSLLVVGLFWWLLLIVWICVRLSSPGPGIFAQERVGKDGKVFTCYKFRTMKEGTKVAGTHEVSATSVTPIGKIIRKLKIDELPQVWNILRNQMGFVGPRPCLPLQKELIAARKAQGVLDVRCGLTGLAQIRGIDMSDPIKLAQKDAEYLDMRTVTLDLKILVQTFLGAGRADRVNQSNETR